MPFSVHKINQLLDSKLEHISTLNEQCYRTRFERDRDRILYSRAFRRLAGKTQVFIPISNDHLRNRLTHTLEVVQIARVISKNLGLNEYLAESIGLGHDLGHTPFGHVGERALNVIMSNCDNFSDSQKLLTTREMGFKHNLQGIRVCVDLEAIDLNHRGLELTPHTLWGILNHSNLTYKPCKFFNKKKCYLYQNKKECKNRGIHSLKYYNNYKSKTKMNNGIDAWSFEGIVVNFADEIAQRHHDIEDAFFMDIMSQEDIIELLDDILSDFIIGEHLANFETLKEADRLHFLPLVSRFLINLYNINIIEKSVNRLKIFNKEYGIKTNDDFIRLYNDNELKNYSNIIGFTDDFLKADKKLQEELRYRILESYKAQRMDGKGYFIIKRIYKAYLTNPKQLPARTLISAVNSYTGHNEDFDSQSWISSNEIRSFIANQKYKKNPRFQICLLRAICDNISGMTDNFVLSEYSKLYGSSAELY